MRRAASTGGDAVITTIRPETMAVKDFEVVLETDSKAEMVEANGEGAIAKTTKAKRMKHSLDRVCVLSNLRFISS